MKKILFFMFIVGSFVVSATDCTYDFNEYSSGTFGNRFNVYRINAIKQEMEYIDCKFLKTEVTETRSFKNGIETITKHVVKPKYLLSLQDYTLYRTVSAWGGEKAVPYGTYVFGIYILKKAGDKYYEKELKRIRWSKTNPRLKPEKIGYIFREEIRQFIESQN